MTHKRVHEIDLLRFLAALSVVFFHYAFRGYAADDKSIMPYPLLEPYFKYGYLGVELFFMISGFVILMTASSGSLKKFAISRIVRLYPAFWVCCSLTFIAILAVGGQRYSATWTQYLVNLTMISGLFGVASIDGAYWSLFVELQFYALVAVILFLGKIHRAQLYLVIWLLAVYVLTLFPIKYLSYFLLTAHAAYFIAGATYYYIWLQGLNKTNIGLIVFSWLLALYQSKSVLLSLEQHYQTAMNQTTVIVIISVFFLLMLLIAVKRTGYWGRRPWLLTGALTYPLYLLHQNIGYMVFNLAYPAFNAHVVFWGTLAGAMALAYAVHILVEKKFSKTFGKYLNSIAP
jgi:peptidoglycan/LPS O-acetylase OafA/YrhL